MEPKVSIIVAIYNSAKFLPKLIESILSQTYKNLEILLVNDGSPDNSGEICDDYAKKDNRIKVLHKKNGGACDARNYGLKKCTGEYVSIIDGDDWLEPDYVEYLLNIILTTNSDMAISYNIFTTRDRKQIKKDNVRQITPEDAAVDIIYPRVPIGPWNKLFKKSLIDNNNLSFCVPWSGEGLYFTVMAAQYSNSVGVGNRKIYNYRLNNSDSGLTHYNVTMGTNALYNIKNIKDKMVIKSNRLKNAINWHIWKNNLFVMKLIIATNSIDKNKELFRQCKHDSKKILIPVLLKSEMNIKAKIVMIFKTLFAIPYFKRIIKKEQQALNNDKME